MSSNTDKRNMAFQKSRKHHSRDVQYLGAAPETPSHRYKGYEGCSRFTGLFIDGNFSSKKWKDAVE